MKYFMANLHERFMLGFELTTTGSSIKLTTDCASGSSHFGVPALLNWARSSIMELFNSVFALFDCFRTVQYE